MKENRSSVVCDLVEGVLQIMGVASIMRGQVLWKGAVRAPPKAWGSYRLSFLLEFSPIPLSRWVDPV